MITNHRASVLAVHVLDGVTTLEAVPEQIRPSVQHLLKLPIYKLACEVLEGFNQEQRKRNLNRIKPHLQDLVKAEAERVFKIRKQMNV